MNLKLLLLGSLSLLANCQAEDTVPTLELPWGNYTAKPAFGDKKIFVFHNVRFGAQPERFGPSTSPKGLDYSVTNLENACIQINTKKSKKAPGGRNRLGDPSEDADSEKFTFKGSEDCLFLDIYAPASAFEPNAKPLPVVVWFYGGAYAFGAKDQFLPLYSGKALIEASNYGAIFVTGNYRLGAFGWLAGSYMEKEGLPNAGLYDQRLLLEWVQEYIDRVKGDKNRVSAWGESAGAGSILHHLIREDGNVNPLFSTFVTQSPAFEWAWDNSTDGQLDTIYRKFSDLAECGFTYNITCLRNAPIDKLANASQLLFDTIHQTGLFPIGPSVDGKWIRTIPTLAFSQGKCWNGIKSAIVSHCANEAESFTPPDVTDEKTFNDFLAIFLPGLETQQDAIKKQYDCQNRFSGNYSLCLRAIIQDASFTCNTRDLIQSYNTQTYAMNYGFPDDNLAYHASDLVPSFTNYEPQAIFMLNKLGMKPLAAAKWASKLWSVVRPRYLSHLASFATTGNVNSGAWPEWPVVNTSGSLFANVTKVSQGGWALVEDDQNSKDTCGFWTEIATGIMDGGKKFGYVAAEAGSPEEL